MNKKKLLIYVAGISILAMTVSFVFLSQNKQSDHSKKEVPVKVVKQKHKTIYKKESYEVTVTVDSED